jgi:hypothetical protein
MKKRGDASKASARKEGHELEIRFYAGAAPFTNFVKGAVFFARNLRRTATIEIEIGCVILSGVGIKPAPLKGATVRHPEFARLRKVRVRATGVPTG